MILSRRLKSNQGVSGVEYGLIAGLLSVAIIGSVSMTGTATQNTFCAVEHGLTGTYSGDCAQARLAQINSLMTALDTQISTFSIDESNLLGIDSSDSNWEQDKSDALANFNGELSTDKQQLEFEQSQLSSFQDDLAKNQGYIDGLANGTYHLQGDVIVGSGRTETQIKRSIASDKQEITRTESSITFYQNDISSTQALIDKYNEDDAQIKEFYAQQASLQAEQDSLSQ